jgi:hypothetical protein
MLKRGMIWALALILLLGALPVASLILAELFASVFGCTLNEGSVHPCVVIGLDFGGQDTGSPHHQHSDRCRDPQGAQEGRRRHPQDRDHAGGRNGHSAADQGGDGGLTRVRRRPAPLHHACGFAPINADHDTRAPQANLPA